MTKHEDMTALRSDPEIHYNCAQSVLIPFAQDIGITREQAAGLALNFGRGMGCGNVCGAVTGALMVMGAMNVPQEKRIELLTLIRREYGSFCCGELMKGLAHGAPERRAKCDRLISDCLDYVCRLTGKE